MLPANTKRRKLILAYFCSNFHQWISSNGLQHHDQVIEVQLNHLPGSDQVIKFSIVIATRVSFQLISPTIASNVSYFVEKEMWIQN